MSHTATADQIELTIDGQSVSVPQGTSIYEAATGLGIEIPALCHSPRMDPVGVCRMCVVDVGARTLTPSCARPCEAGMQVETSSPKVEKHRRMLTQLLVEEIAESDPTASSKNNCDVTALANKYKIAADPPQNAHFHDNRFQDHSSPVIAVDHQACILCDRCIRACDDIQSNEVIGRTGKGHTARIAFDLDVPMGESTCVSCGECAAVCPTNALTHKPVTLPIVDAVDVRDVDSVCPYCGVGCAVTVHATDDTILAVSGRESPVNHERLCVKGRYGWDYALHPQRLTKPLIRREEYYPKGPLSPEVQDSDSRTKSKSKPGGIVDYDTVLPAFREATWDEALDLVANRFKTIREERGGDALAGFGSAKCSNEEAYLFQKLIRAVFGTNNVDHCTRLCHASSVAALMETIGSGAVTNVFADVARADVALLTGSHAGANHPVAATFMKEAVKNGTKLIVVDVRRHDLVDFATHFAQIHSGSDVAFYNAVMHVLITEDLVDHDFINARTEGFPELRELVLRDFSPEQTEPMCGVAAEEIRQIARTIGRAGSMLVFWGMGIAQHTTGTDNARCLISLCLMTGNMGRPGTGLHPLRGQNNVQGASDAGLIPMVYPDYQPVTNKEVRQKFEQAWGVELSPDPGLTVVEITHAALQGDIAGMYVLGENPFVSDPNTNKVRGALTNLDFLVVQDIFLTETAEFADVILPASSYFEKTGTFTNTDRRVQVGRQVLDPPGEAHADWQITADIASRMGYPMDYASPAEIFEEFAGLTKNYQGLTHKLLGATGKLWPCTHPETEDGTQILFGDKFPTPHGRGKFVPCPFLPADELPNDEYPFVLTTGRVLEHWHTGTMTRRSRALNALQPDAFVVVHPQDLSQLGISGEQLVRVSSRRGTIVLAARSDNTVSPGTIFIPFHFREAAANVLTTDALDPYGKIPEFKFCAVKIDAAV